MYGEAEHEPGTLNVYMKLDESYIETLVWSRSGNQVLS